MYVALFKALIERQGVLLALNGVYSVLAKAKIESEVEG
jgi:hypothetical protein